MEQSTVELVRTSSELFGHNIYRHDGELPLMNKNLTSLTQKSFQV